MKKITVCMMSLAGVVAVTWSFSGLCAEAQTPVAAPPGTPPLGRQVEIQMTTWPFTTAVTAKVGGTLIAMTDQWIVVKDGSDEIWVPRDKVMLMKASK